MICPDQNITGFFHKPIEKSFWNCGNVEGTYDELISKDINFKSCNILVKQRESLTCFLSIKISFLSFKLAKINLEKTNTFFTEMRGSKIAFRRCSECVNKLASNVFQTLRMYEGGFRMKKHGTLHLHMVRDIRLHLNRQNYR